MCSNLMLKPGVILGTFLHDPLVTQPHPTARGWRSVIFPCPRDGRENHIRRVLESLCHHVQLVRGWERSEP